MISGGMIEAEGHTAYIQRLFENYLENYNFII